MSIFQDVVVGSIIPKMRGAAAHDLANVLKEELSCMLCSDIFYEPWTAPCGHTFCEPCVARALDHSPRCPGCRQDIGGEDDDELGFLMLTNRLPNKLLKQLVGGLYPAEVRVARPLLCLSPRLPHSIILSLCFPPFSPSRSLYSIDMTPICNRIKASESELFSD